MTNEANGKIDIILREIADEIQEEVDDINEYLRSIDLPNRVHYPPITAEIIAVADSGNITTAINSALSSYQDFFKQLIANASDAVEQSSCSKKVIRSLMAFNSDLQQNYASVIQSLGKDFKANIKAQEKALEKVTSGTEKKFKACLSKDPPNKLNCIAKAVKREIIQRI